MKENNEHDLSRGQKAYLTRIVNEFKEDAKNELDYIKSIKNKLIEGDDDNPSLLEKFENSENRINEISSQIASLHQDIFVPKIQGQQPLSDSLIDFTEKFKHSRSEINEIKEDIQSYYDDLFGTTNEFGIKIDGIQAKINGQIEKLDQLHTSHKSKQENLFHEIEKLLKGASTVALAKSFGDHKKSFDTTNYIWMALFILSIVSMMIISVYIFDKADFDIKDMWKGTVGNLPFIGGAIWIAIYASKQRSQNKRLQQEYAFKEDVAKIYYGLKKEIEELDDTELGKELNMRILEIIVDVVSANPSNTLESNSHNDKGPIMEALNNISSLIKKND